MNVDIKAEFLVDELTRFYHKYDSKKLREDILICLDILKYYDLNDENNRTFASYVLRILFVLKAKIEENLDLTTDLSNLVAKGFVTGSDRSVFHRRENKNSEEFNEDLEYYVERNYFDEEYERLQRILIKNSTKLEGTINTSLIGFNYEKLLRNTIQLMDNQELVLRLEAIIIRILKPLSYDKITFDEKLEVITNKLGHVVTNRETYLKKYMTDY